MDLRRPSYSNEVEKLAQSICPGCRVCIEKMWEPERQALAPSYLVIFVGKQREKLSELFLIDAQVRQWSASRDGPDRVIVDPTPRYKVEDP